MAVNIGIRLAWFLLLDNTNRMRITGYILLTIGFLWLAVWSAGSTDSLTRSIGPEHFKHYPGFAKYSGDEVCAAIRSVLAEYQDKARGVTFPAAVMLVGGILLDVANRRAKRTTPDTISLEGPVERINDDLTVRIPFDVGGDKLAPFAGKMGKVDGAYLNVTIQPRLAKKLKISDGSMVSVDNHNGKFTISRSAADEQPAS